MTTYRKEGDTGPPLGDQLIDDKGNKVPINKHQDIELEVKDLSGNVVIADDESGNVESIDSSEGKVRYNFQSGDLDTTGTFIYEWVVTFDNGEEETFPNRTEGEVLIVIPD